MEDSDLGKAVEDLQKSVAALEQRNKDLVLKAQIFSMRAVGSWGWDSFLSEPEFWENTVDSGMADCAGRCISNLARANKACDTQHANDPLAWEACRKEAVAASVACHANCSASNPVIP